MIFSDLVLSAVAHARPAGNHVLAALPGVSTKAAERYGPPLLRAVADYAARHSLQLAAEVPAPTEGASGSTWRSKRDEGNEQHSSGAASGWRAKPAAAAPPAPTKTAAAATVANATAAVKRRLPTSFLAGAKPKAKPKT